MAAKTYEIAFKIAGGINSSLQKSINAASNAISGMSKTIVELNNKANQVDNVLKLRKEVGESARKYQDARQKVAELGRAISKTAEPTKQMVSEFNRAKTAASRAKEALNKKREALHQLQKTTGTAGQSIKQLIARQNELESQTNRARIAQENFNKITGRMQGNLSAMKDSAMYASAVGAGISAGLGSAIKTGMDFDTTMSGVKAVARASAEDMDALRAQAKKLGADTVWSASQVAEGMQFLSMAGFKAQDTLKAMPGMLDLATAGSIDLGRASDIASNILTGFGLKADEMGRLGDVLTNTFTSSNVTLEMLGQTMKYAAPVAKNMGVSVEELAGMAGKLGDAGIQGEMAGTTLRAVLLRLSAPSAKAQDALDELGVSVKDSSGNMRKYPDILADLQKAMSGMSDGTRAELTKAIFETEAMSGAMVLMEQAGKGALSPYIESLKETGTASKTAKEKSNNLAGDVTNLKSKIEAFAISIYESVNPALRSMAQAATALMAKIIKFTTEHQTATKVLTMVAGAIGVVTTAAFPLYAIYKALTFATNTYKLAGNGIALMFQRQTYAIIANKAALAAQKVGMIAQTVAMAAMKIPLIATTVAQWAFNAALWACPVTWIVAAIVGLIAVGYLLWKNWDKIKAKTMELWQAFQEKFPAMASYVKLATLPMRVAIQAVIIVFKLLAAAGIALWNGLKWCFEGIKSAAVAYWNWYVDKILWVWDKMKQFGSYVASPFVSLFQAMGDKISAIFSTLGDAVKAGLNGAIGFANSAIAGLNKFKFKLPKWAGGGEIGFNIAQIPALASGGIATSPTLAMIGEGREDEAVLPLSKLGSMLGADAGGGSINVTFSPVINLNGGSDAYSQVERGLSTGVSNLKKELAKLLQEQRRLSYA